MALNMLGTQFIKIGLYFILSSFLLACEPPTFNQKEYDWNLPKGFPKPLVPSDNPMSTAKVALGKRRIGSKAQA
jgi:cytochrome c peroxidase